MTAIYKILRRDEWQAALAAGVFTGSAVDVKDGYIHFSTAAQAQETAAKHFRGASDLIVLEIDSDVLGDGLTWEPSRGGVLFPHLYGALDVKHVRAVTEAPLNADGVPNLTLATAQVTGRDTVFDSPWVRVVAKTVSFLPAPFYAVEVPDYVAVCARTPDGRIILVRQYRPTIERLVWELPAGVVDPGETPDAAVARELARLGASVAVHGNKNAAAAEQHHGRAHAALAQREFRLQIFELEADTARVVGGEEFVVGIGKAEGCRGALRRLRCAPRGGDVLLGRSEGRLALAAAGSHACLRYSPKA